MADYQGTRIEPPGALVNCKQAVQKMTPAPVTSTFTEATTYGTQFTRKPIPSMPPKPLHTVKGAGGREFYGLSTTMVEYGAKDGLVDLPATSIAHVEHPKTGQNSAQARLSTL